MRRITVILLLAAAGPLRAQETRIVSISDAGTSGDGVSGSEGLDAVVDDQGDVLVLFSSYATNLVAGDTNHIKDLFLRNVSAGTTTRVVMGLNGAEPDGDVIHGQITPDGRFVAFVSYATNLVSGDTNGRPDVFLLDRTSGVIELVSVDVRGEPTDGDSFGASVTSDARYVAFFSFATDLMKSGLDTNGVADVFVRDRKSAATLCVSVDASGLAGNGESRLPTLHTALSLDGGTVLFSSLASNLVKGDNNGVQDVFARNLVNGITTRVSLDSGGAELATESFALALSPKGSVALFRCKDANVLPGFSNGLTQAYARILGSGELLPAAARSDGTPLATDNRFLAATIAGDDGSDFDPLVAFIADDDGIVPGDVAGNEEVYVRRLRGGEVQQVSIGSDGGPPIYGRPTAMSVTLDGKYVAFDTNDFFEAPPDQGFVIDVYLRGLCWTLFSEFGAGLGGSGGFAPRLFGRSGSCEDLGYSMHVRDGLGGTFGLLWIGFGRTAGTPLFGGTWYIDFTKPRLILPLFLDGAAGAAGAGSLDLDGVNAEGLGSFSVYLQGMFVDAGAPFGVSLSNATELEIVE